MPGTRIAGAHPPGRRAGNRQVADILEAEHPGPDAILEIMADIGDVIGSAGGLRLRRGLAAQIEMMRGVKLGECKRDRSRHRAIMLGHALQGFECEIQPIVADIAALEPGHDADCLRIVFEPSKRLHFPCQRILAGMSEWRVAQIMRQCDGICQVGIQPELGGQRPGDPRNLDGMGEASPEVIAIRRDKHLGLVHQPAECGRVNDPVAIALEWRAAGGLRDIVQPGALFRWPAGIGCQPLLLVWHPRLILAVKYRGQYTVDCRSSKRPGFRHVHCNSSEGVRAGI